MPDPKPKDLSNQSEMSTFKDEEIFTTISRDMKDTSPGGDKIGDDEFAVPTMPTFKYTLAEEEIWAIVDYVRSLHGMKMEFKVEERRKELEEAVTDPDLNAWYDPRGQENADKCAWTFGTTYLAANGSRANMKLGTMDYLIQQNWANAGGGCCALKY